MQKIMDNWLENSTTKDTNEVVMIHKMNIMKYLKKKKKSVKNLCTIQKTT